MEIVYDDAQLRKYVDRALKEAQADTVVSGRLPSPLLIDKFLQDAVEIDVDALFDGEELYIGGIMEHVEEAGVHSGDAACTLPPSTLSDDQIRRLREGTYAIAKGCGVQGLINVQYAFMANTLYVIEANPRASRTVRSLPRHRCALAKAAARIMVGETIQQQRDNGLLLPHATVATSIAASRWPSRNPCFRSSDSALRSARPSTCCSDRKCVPPERSWASTATSRTRSPRASSPHTKAACDQRQRVHLRERHRQAPAAAVRRATGRARLQHLATEGTASVLRRYGIDSKIVDKISVRMDSDPDDPITTYHAEAASARTSSS